MAPGVLLIVGILIVGIVIVAMTRETKSSYNNPETAITVVNVTNLRNGMKYSTGLNNVTALQAGTIPPGPFAAMVLHIGTGTRQAYLSPRHFREGIAMVTTRIRSVVARHKDDRQLQFIKSLFETAAAELSLYRVWITKTKCYVNGTWVC